MAFGRIDVQVESRRFLSGRHPAQLFFLFSGTERCLRGPDVVHRDPPPATIKKSELVSDFFIVRTRRIDVQVES